jgi:hypothetical protein
MDIRDLKFNEGDFDVVLDKGTMDAMLTSKGDVWVSAKAAGGRMSVRTDDPRLPRQNPPEGDVQNCRKEVEEAIR